ncbi:peptide-methionine (S)-S-oxide reductase MsrA [Zoogloea sp.]|uniref:peptide-methionine (S)-S-oxide reductase MsrA n=1 Tax=Zoogloea sp. TaxID=49181 RepID=UPI001AD00494|nr:peptide-methionine (S)-S-oxide reductase MsrA [Zoogloea sp.]MBN8282190.1 peptide-methionine (S)-S-oxide reductase MsrA [Zoogloea sp.]
MAENLPKTELAILAGGCFWCLEAVYLGAEGVHSVTSGYIGGHVDAPTYERICDGDTGHAEAVRIEFDPAVIGFADLLDIFFAIHDPTTPNRQGNDVGTQYRSAIFATTPEQEALAREKVAELNEEAHFGAPIVTEILAAPRFWPAEPYHHDYFSRNGHQPYCQYVVAPKVAKFRSKFAKRVKAT